MTNARRTAALALAKQEQNGYSNLVLAAALEREALSPRDKAFVSALFYGVTERLLPLDWALGQCLAKPLAKLDAPVRAVLRCGLYEAKYMNTPVPAAVSEAVSLCRQLKKASAAGLVNAVLRRAVALDVSAARFKDRAEELSVRYSVGRPIVELLLEQYPDRAEGMLASFFEKPPVTLRCNTLRCTPARLCEALAREGINARPLDVPGAVEAEFSGSPAATEAFRQGLYHVQGLASQAAALCLEAQPGETVLDLCAAPGGKTLLLAQQMGDKGRLLSFDAAENRLPLIEAAAARCGLSCVTVAKGDASVYDPALAGADRVLCDVPCSGLGIIAKKPDIRYKSLEGGEKLRALQLKILANAARYVKEGGRLVYSTCTVDKRENGEVVRAFLAGHGEFVPEQPPVVLPGALLEDKMQTMLPGFAGPDGFFTAVLRRRGVRAGTPV
ncbi:MAG TPA: 16S rRNA (cytosine(967)-C(5))-methyltransferase RsmB [Candidatus Fournierella merdigallinarum]|nr:16S rRNA (cytosine(967)-C(5))-methyltransferase RsmB [Candidatus Fournierella merdigallinarum]